MALTATEAAALAGVSKSAILKAIKTGKVSAIKNQNEEWRIEPVELLRHYEPVGEIPQQDVRQSAESADSVQREVELLREMIQRQDEVIADLRERLDVATDGWHKTTLILSDKQQPPRSWWARLLDGSRT